MNELRHGPRQNNAYAKPLDLERDHEMDVIKSAKRLFRELRGDCNANTKAATVIIGTDRFVISVTQVTHE